MALTGQGYYQQLCASCHDSSSIAGADGQGQFKINAAKFTTDAALSDFIAANMPKGDVGACTNSCAKAITAFIRANYLNTNNPGSSQFDAPLPAASALRKIKNLLTGLAPTDAELAKGTSPDALRTLMGEWMNTPQFDEKCCFILPIRFSNRHFLLRILKANCAIGRVRLICPTAFTAIAPFRCYLKI